MNAPERTLNLNVPSAPSGVHARTAFETPMHRPEEEDLDALVQRASSRPPAANVGFDEIHVPRLPPLVSADLQALLAPPPLTLAPAAAQGLSTGVKAMIALPWTLLFIGGAGVALAWPRAEGSASADAVVETAQPSVDVAAADVAPAAVESPTLGEALAPDVVTARVTEDESNSREAREERERSSTVPGSAAAAVVPNAIDAESNAPEGAPAEATVAAAPAVEGASATAPAPSVAPNGTNFEAIVARVQGGTSNAPAADPVSSTGALPERPSRGDVSRALRGVQSSVDACTSDVGTAMVRLTVAGDGTVTAASATGDYAGTSAGSCMADAVRGAHFPPFTANSMTITYPFTLH